MNSYLKSAAKRYKEKFEKDFLIHPISEIDGEIIVELMELFKKAGLNEVSAILKQYKYKKDEEIRDELLDLNINFKKRQIANKVSEDELEDEGEEEYSKVIIFNDHQQTFIQKFYILGGKKIVFVDKDTGSESPAILINEVDELSTKKPMYSNTVLLYDTEEERDEDYTMLINEMKY